MAGPTCGRGRARLVRAVRSRQRPGKGVRALPSSVILHPWFLSPQALFPCTLSKNGRASATYVAYYHMLVGLQYKKFKIFSAGRRFFRQNGGVSREGLCKPLMTGCFAQAGIGMQWPCGVFSPRRRVRPGKPAQDSLMKVSHHPGRANDISAKLRVGWRHRAGWDELGSWLSLH